MSVTVDFATMSYLLCHGCYSWVEPKDERCPDCLQSVDSASMEPPLHSLQTTIGPVVRRLGEVSVPRKSLPDRGMLYATAGGFFFVPHQVEHVVRMKETEAPTPTLLWSLASLIWSPLVLVAPLFRSKRREPKWVPVFRSRFLKPGQCDPLPTLLVEHPGTFFVTRDSISVIRRKRHRWILERLATPPVKLKVQGNRAAFHRRMRELLAEEPWQSLAFA